MAKVKKEEYKLPNPLVYRLNNPNYTIYHRAALGGLASTIMAWGENQPEGITAKVERDEVSLSWDGEKLSDQDFLRELIKASFKLTNDGNKMIDLPGQRLDVAREDLRLAVHNGITSTFLQHPKMRLGEKGSRRIGLKTDDNTENFFTYKALDSFAHQKAQKTGLLDEKLKGNLPAFAAIQQWTIPGITSGAEELFAPTEEAILLLFLMVGSVIFMLRPRTFKEKARSCLVVPDVIDLLEFAESIDFINIQQRGNLKMFSNNYLNRVVGGVEEAGLRFLLDLETAKTFRKHKDSVSGCIVIAMGKVAWDKNQINRSLIAKVRGNYKEINVFKAAREYLGMSKVIKLENGDAFVVPSSPVPELIAANLANDRHWCSNFVSLVSEKKDFQQMFYSIGGLQKMKDEIKDTEDQIIIAVFQEALYYTRGALSDRAKRDELGDKGRDRLFEVRNEKMRNDILRAKTADALSSWFLRFCADATKGGTLPSLRKDGDRVRKFIFNQRNFERFQNLCLFALVSYTGKEKSNSQEGESK